MLSQCNGTLALSQAVRKSKCSRCGCEITGGTVCVELPVVSLGMTSKKRYCMACGHKIVETTQADLDKVKTSLQGDMQFRREGSSAD